MLGVSWSNPGPMCRVRNRGDHGMVLGPTVQRTVHLIEYQSRGVRLFPYRFNIAHAVAALGVG